MDHWGLPIPSSSSSDDLQESRSIAVLDGDDINVGVHASRMSTDDLVGRVLPRLRAAADELPLCMR